MTKIMIPTFVLLFSHMVFAAAPAAKNKAAVVEPETLSLQQQAVKEAQLTDPKALKEVEKSQASERPEAQVSSEALKLADPFEPLTMRTFVWTFGFQAQSYQPQGRARLADQTGYALSQAGSTVLPSVSLGTLYNLGRSQAGHFQLGLNGQLGYTSQNIKAETSNNVALDARLSTTQLEGKILLRWALRAESKLHLLAHGGIGQLAVSQSSNNSVARWSESAIYQTSGLGLEYNLNDAWLTHLTYNHKSINESETTLDIQNNNLELGAKVIW